MQKVAVGVFLSLIAMFQTSLAETAQTKAFATAMPHSHIFQKNLNKLISSASSVRDTTLSLGSKQPQTTCVDFSGKWKGVCTDEYDDTEEEEITILQTGCAQLSYSVYPVLLVDELSGSFRTQNNKEEFNGNLSFEHGVYKVQATWQWKSENEAKIFSSYAFQFTTHDPNQSGLEWLAFGRNEETLNLVYEYATVNAETGTYTKTPVLYTKFKNYVSALFQNKEEKGDVTGETNCRYVKT